MTKVGWEVKHGLFRRLHDSNGQLIFGSQENERQKGIIVLGLFVSGGRNAERGMIALRVQDPTARHEEGINDNTVLRLSGRPVSS